MPCYICREDVQKLAAKSDLTRPCHQFHVMLCHESSCATSFCGLCKLYNGEI